MTQRILKHLHRPLNLIPAFMRYIGISRTDETNMVYHTVKFNPDCMYHIDGEDQMDWSKVFGFCFGIFGIHKNSIRFGWRYNPDIQKIELARLMYFGDNQHTMDKLCSVNVNSTHDLCIAHEYDGQNLKITMYVDDRSWETVIPRPSCRLRFGCWFYFGGNRRAPQTVSIEID